MPEELLPHLANLRRKALTKGRYLLLRNSLSSFTSRLIAVG